MQLKSYDWNLNTALFQRNPGKLRSKVPPTSALPLTQRFSPPSLLHAALGSIASTSCSPDHRTRQGKSPSCRLFSLAGHREESASKATDFKTLFFLSVEGINCFNCMLWWVQFSFFLIGISSALSAFPCDWFEVYFAHLVPGWQTWGEVRRHGWLFQCRY